MSRRRRTALATLAAVALVAFGLLTDSAAHAESAPVRDCRIATHSARAVAGAATHAERRAQLDRTGWAPAKPAAAAGWVRVLASVAAVSAGAAGAAGTQSRAPPA